jgi:hypothetical protein
MKETNTKKLQVVTYEGNKQKTISKLFIFTFYKRCLKLLLCSWANISSWREKEDCTLSKISGVFFVSHPKWWIRRHGFSLVLIFCDIDHVLQISPQRNVERIEVRWSCRTGIWSFTSATNPASRVYIKVANMRNVGHIFQSSFILQLIWLESSRYFLQRYFKNKVCGTKVDTWDKLWHRIQYFACEIKKYTRDFRTLAVPLRQTEMCVHKHRDSSEHIL